MTMMYVMHHGFRRDLAAFAAVRGERDAAFDLLEQTFAHDPASAKGVVQNALLAPLHADARWLPFLRKIGADPDTLGKIRFALPLPP